MQLQKQFFFLQWSLCSFDNSMNLGAFQSKNQPVLLLFTRRRQHWKACPLLCLQRFTGDAVADATTASWGAWGTILGMVLKCKNSCFSSIRITLSCYNPGIPATHLSHSFSLLRLQLQLQLHFSSYLSRRYFLVLTPLYWDLWASRSLSMHDNQFLPKTLGIALGCWGYYNKIP